MSAAGTTSPRTVLLVDDDGESAAVLGRLEEVLINLQPFEDDDAPAPADLGQVERDAAGALALAVSRAERQPGARFCAGTFDFGEVRAVQIDAADLEAVRRAIAALGRALLPQGNADVREVIESWCDHTRARPETPQELVARFATVHGILDLAADTDVELLVPLTHTPGPVALDKSQEAAFRTYLDRLMAMQQNDPLQRFLYLG